MVERIHGLWREHPRVAWVLVGVLLIGVLSLSAPALLRAGTILQMLTGETSFPPESVTATLGAAPPTISVLSWSPGSGSVDGYTVWRSISATGTFERIGSASIDATSFTDESGIPGQPYYYAVSSHDAAGRESALSSAKAVGYSEWVPTPHGLYGDGTASCLLCHSPHNATPPTLSRSTGAGSGGQTAVCANCHDGRTDGPDALTGGTDSFGLASGHTLEQAAPGAADLTNTCSSCHAPHMSPSASPGLPAGIVNGVAVTSADRDACEACHNDANDWAGGAYPDPSSPSRDASGYPVSGTFPGATTYDDAANPHANIASSNATRATGSCLNCHAAHRGANSRDGLTLSYRPSTSDSLADDQTSGAYAEACFACHEGSAASQASTAPVDIKRYATSTSQFAGHRILTAGGNLPVGAPLPCYDCHNPHGSTRGNASMLSDALGGSLTTQGSAEQVRQVCLSCHVSSDGFVWDSVAGALAPVTTTSTVEGLHRDGSDGSKLRLPSESAHASADGRSCEQCHGHDYSTDESRNVHDPLVGASPGGIDCYACHSDYQAFMEDGTGAKTGSSRTLTYHHVMGGNFDNGSYRDGDLAPGATGSYNTTGTTELFCVSCHTDHDLFAGNKGANLRSSFGTGTVEATNTDFSPSLPQGGLCTSCHATALAKDVDNQASAITSSTSNAGTLTPVIDPAAYGQSAHSYTATSSFDVSPFLADCSKCHNDNDPGSYKASQSSAVKFGAHFSPDSRLLAVAGPSGPSGDEVCFACHSTADAALGAKPLAGLDWYGAAAMSERAESIAAAFARGGSRHPVGGDAGAARVSCENCHNSHTASAANPLADPENTYAAAAYSSPAEQSGFCLTCHDGSAPVAHLDETTLVPSGVDIPEGDALVMNKATYGGRGHWSASGSIATTETQSCGVCHDGHGSVAPFLLGVFDPASGTNRINGTTITANDNTACVACHAAPTDGYPGTARDATGYVTDGRWPGITVFGGAGGIHSGAGVVWPGGSAAGGTCVTCHDPHGTANSHDELRSADGGDSYTSTTFALCLTCHDSSGPSTADIRRYYPAQNGGLAMQIPGVTTYGHAITSATGTLPIGSGLPCYDCHAAHGSAETTYALQVVTQTSAATTIVVGDEAGELDLSAAAGYRRFCLTCHTTGDTVAGWNGSVYAVVTVGAKVEGIDRTASLKLPPGESAHAQSSGEACWDCHGRDYSGATSRNVHNPARSN